MKQTLISTSIVAMLSTGAIAGNIDLVTADPVIAIPPTSTVTDWSGGYVGLSYSARGGTMDYFFNFGGYSSYVYVDDTAIGVFGGYNWQRGNLVYGGELNVTEGSLVLDGFNEKLDTTIELRGRVGYAMGDALVYGFFGYGMSEYMNLGLNSRQHDVAGGTYGLGIDYMVTDSIFAGLEVSNRELTGTTTFGSDQTNYIDMISLRIGYNY